MLGGTVLNCYIGVSVFDHGPEIPPENMGKLKQLFIRATDARRCALRFGLGLAIVDRIAAAHAAR